MRINGFGGTDRRAQELEMQNEDEIRCQTDFILQSSTFDQTLRTINACEAAFYYPSMRQTRPEALVARYAIA